MTIEHDEVPVVEFAVKMPGVTVDSPEGYRVGQTLRLAIEVRVKGVSYDENSEGFLTKTHKLGLEDVEVVAVYDRGEAHDTVGGSLSGAAASPGPDDDLPVEVQKSGELWPQGLREVQ